MNDPCTVTYSPGEKSVTCTYPLGKLPPGGSPGPVGVLVRWEAAGFPNFHLPEPNTTIGGRPAFETRTSGGDRCAPLGGTETITVMIPRDVPDNWFRMDACLRAPRPAPARSADCFNAQYGSHSQGRLSAVASAAARLAAGRNDEDS
jgi:hypothetical protein